MINNKVILQCSKEQQPEHIVNQLMKHAAGWEYVWFNDELMIKYMQENIIEEFPDAVERMLAYPHGPHRADFFRYFYLYLNGGLFLDSDLMIYASVDRIVGDSDFVTSVADKSTPYTLFNGLLACNKEDKRIYEALKSVYNFDPTPEYLKHNVNAICTKLYSILKDNPIKNKKLYRENIIFWENTLYSVIYDKDTVIAAHFFRGKVIPNWETIEPNNLYVERLKELLSVKIAPDVKYTRLGSYYDGGYVMSDDITKNDFCVSFGVEGNIDFEEDFLKVGSGIHAYDNSINGLPEQLDGISFFKETVGEETSLEDVLSRIESTNDLILKMDIEGSEISLINKASEEQLKRFRQMIIEVHWITSILEDAEKSNALIQALEKITTTHNIVLVHANNHSSLKLIDGTVVQDVIEILLLRKSDYDVIDPLDQFRGLVRRCRPHGYEHSSIGL
jgi:FkbM family methyltransferase